MGNKETTDEEDPSNSHRGQWRNGPSATTETTTTEEEIRRQLVLRRLYIASALCSCFIVVEVIGGVIANSLAIMSDAAHLFSDLASFAVAIAASYLASLPATEGHTFGLKRTESLAALFSMVSLAFVSVWLAYEAVKRFIEPPEDGVDGKVMSGVATIGVCVNIVLAFVLGEDHVHMPGAHDHDHSHGHDHHGGGCSSSGGSGVDSHDHGHGHSSSSSGHDHNNNKDHENGHHDDHHDHHSTSHDHGHDHGHGHDHHRCDDEKDSLIGHEHKHEHKHDNFDAIHLDEAEASQQQRAIDQRNVNLRAAYLHVMADLLQSVAVLIAGLVIWFKPEWHIIDPICTLLFCCVVFYSTIGVFKSSLSVLLEATPPQINWTQVYNSIKNVPDVTDVHDLHIWSISHGQPSLSVHCTSPHPQQAIININKVCSKHGISHSTIQVQTEEGSCVTCETTECCTSSLLV